MFGKLSGGQKQRALFGLALCGNPDLIFLDEPTVGMDIESRRALWDQVRALSAAGKTILLTTHYLEEADMLANRIVVINKGKLLCEGTSAEIKHRVSGRKIRCVTQLDLEFLQSAAHRLRSAAGSRGRGDSGRASGEGRSRDAVARRNAAWPGSLVGERWKMRSWR